MASEATQEDAPAAGAPEVLGSLSPSRAADFRSCPLRYRYRTIDRLPEPPSADALRGTLVHRVLELIFDEPAAERTPERAAQLLPRAWADISEHDDEAIPQDLFADESSFNGWLASAFVVLSRWFALEDPRRLDPAAREVKVKALLDSGLLLRGYVDRVDVAEDGAVRVVDYKTGKSPRPGQEARALFQLRFYALAIWRSRGVVPRELSLVYLGNTETITYQPDEDDLRATERVVEALWQAIRAARDTQDWRPSPGHHCSWCSFQELCPVYGGTPPPVPDRSKEAATTG